ncbi:formate dehydrogenase [Sinimarinibacterium sp. CAU 1509]|uniref:molybdopterin-containing oxidoreductase family protein n=1 Tax=Sinimarinibacterium sp. CAU 1509 TaxID=2562283 RepID=UPI0010AC5AE0|nr:molybdopterin-dependent oxidoreductase [Sinimarinibacterium sp. CAU 1509]TJY59027.1 formate dehydrogenase [Sinimarinibacterium sp. CAU 1509]
MRTEKTYCRICEAHCGLDVTIDGDAVVAVKPDKTHPVSRGYACIKGSALGELHHDPDRVNHPLKKVNGTWQRIGWPQAIAEIGSRIRTLQKTHGRRSVAHYYGNPTAFSMQNFLYSAAFMQALGSPNVFTSSSIDLNNKFHVADAMYGMLDVHPVPDFAHCEFFMCLGSNPMVSQMSVVAVTHVMEKLSAIEDRGGRVIVIDPRRTETAQHVGEHHFIRPGTDAWLLLGMAHVVAHELELDPAAIHAHANGLTAFLAAVKDWTPERVAPLTGLSAERIRELATAYARARGAVLYMSTGVNMGPFGSIAYWLVQGLSLITGNLDARGGLVFSRGAFDVTKLIKVLEGKKVDGPRTLKDGWRQEAGAFPAAALADEILIDHPQRIRALIISAGNPVHSIPGNRLAEAFEHLELRVCIDLYLSETAQQADYVLPATDMLERSDFPLSHLNFQAEPHAQYTAAVLAPKFERRPEWWIFTQLAQAAGAPLLGPTLMNWPARLSRVFDRLPLVRGLQPDDVLALLLRLGGKTTLAELKRNPQGVALPAVEPGNFLGKRVPSADGKVNLAPATVLKDLTRLAAAAGDYAAETAGLRVIGRRERRSHNSWMHNNRRIKHDSGISALMHPADAVKRGIADGDLIEVGTGRNVAIPVRITEDIMPGVLCVPHGWGHAQSGLGKASMLPGSNINEALPDVALHMEPVSGQAIMLGHVLEVRRVGARQRVA